MAEEALATIAAYCNDHCPVVNRCVEAGCRLWRLEQEAAAFLEGTGPAEVIAL